MTEADDDDDDDDSREGEKTNPFEMILAKTWKMEHKM